MKLSDIPYGSAIVDVIKKTNGQIKVMPGYSNLLGIIRKEQIISPRASVTKSTKNFYNAIPLLLEGEYIAIKDGYYFVFEKK